MFKAEIRVNLKHTVVDPQGQTVKHALESMGYGNLEEVRMGKFITIRLNSRNRHKAEEEVEAMCRRLLANPIIENYSFRITELRGAGCTLA